MADGTSKKASSSRPPVGDRNLDAMGRDKRREVIGHAYGPSRKSQGIFFGVIALLVAIVFGGSSLAIGEFDQPQDSYSDQAPWTDNQVETLDPSNPCGEPGNVKPIPETSSCAPDFAKDNNVPPSVSTLDTLAPAASGDSSN